MKRLISLEIIFLQIKIFIRGEKQFYNIEAISKILKLITKNFSEYVSRIWILLL